MPTQSVKQQQWPYWIQLFLVGSVLSWGGLHLQARTDADFLVAEASPVEGTSAVSGSCNDSPITAFSPDIAHTVSFPAPARTQISSCSATMSLSGAVNGDTSPSVACSIGDQQGFVVTYSRTPHMKLGGLQCVTQDRSILEVHGDGSDGASVDIAIDAVGAATWGAAKKVDDATSAARDTLFGTNGQVGTAGIIDGSDRDGSTNGEVDFGGTTASQGASVLFMKADYTNYDLQATTDQETLTFTFTAQ